MSWLLLFSLSEVQARLSDGEAVGEEPSEVQLHTI